MIARTVKLYPTREQEARFARKVFPEPNTGCQLWNGAADSSGYGSFSVDGHSVQAHRFAWELKNGAIPDGLFVCHRCDTRLCVNADHMFLGTNADNMRDASSKGRIRCQKVDHCPKGHPYSGDNLIVRRDGVRRCAECRRASNRKSMARSRARAKA